MATGFELEYASGSVATYPAGATFGPRVLRDYEMVWIVEGNVIYHADGRDYAAPPGAMILGRPGFRDGFTWDPHRETRHAFFHFHFRALPGHWPAPEHWPVVWLMPENDIVRPLFRYVLSQGMWRRPQRDATLPASSSPPTLSPQLVCAVETLLGALLVGPVAQIDELSRDLPEPVRRAMLFIERTLSQDPRSKISLSDLARASAVSGEHLCRQFAQALRMTPMQAVRYQRLEVANSLLARSNLNVEQIAYRCGFASPYHFSRIFKETFGSSPTAMRKLIESGEPPRLTPLVRVMSR